MEGKVTVTVLSYFLFHQPESLFLKSCFLSSEMQLMTEQQIPHSSIWTSSSKPAQHFGMSCWWKKVECQIGHLWKAFLNHMASFLKSGNKPQCDSTSLFRPLVLRNPLSSPLKCWFWMSGPVTYLDISVWKTLDQMFSFNRYFFFESRNLVYCYIKAAGSNLFYSAYICWALIRHLLVC